MIKGHPIQELTMQPCIQELMVDPVSTCDGHTYERKAIEQWLRTKGTSPLTGSPLGSISVIPNIALRKLITEFLDQ